MFRLPRGIVVALFSASLLAPAATATAGAKWEKVDPADAALTAPTVDPESGAEVLLWRISVEDAVTGPSVYSSVTHFLRVKVFDERGAASAGNAEILYDKGTVILDFAARTVRTDGSMVEVPRTDRFERTVVKAGGVKRKALAFAFPSVTPGAILEYRWSERRYDYDIEAVSLVLQRDLPVRLRELRVKPLPLGMTEWNFKMRCFGMPPPAFALDRDGFQRALLPPIRGLQTEPHMPPEYQTVPWATFYYTRTDDQKLDELWKEFARDQFAALSNRLKVDDAVKRTAAEITAGIAGDADRLNRLADWCRGSIENWNDDRLGAPVRDLEAMPRNKTPAETLSRKGGRANDLVYLFVALGRASGLDVRVALTGDRSEFFFDSRMGLKGFLDNPIAVARIGERLHFYDPGIRWLRGEGLAWWEDGQEALIVDRERAEFVPVPMTPPDSTRYVRVAHLRLADDGTLDGEVRLEFHGAAAAAEREYLDDLTPEERLERIRKRYLPQVAELVTSNAAFEHLEDTGRPLVAACAVRVPRYATVIGSRFLAPVAFFQSDHQATFPSDERRHPIYFHFPWSDEDTVSLALPEGFEVEGAPDLEPLVVKGVGAYRSSIVVAMDGRTARFHRSFRFGDGDAIYFPQSQYAGLKKVFDGVHERDRITVSLKRAAATAGGASEPK
ncbi:MAG TPA: DUF3857 domain-containing protein [Acidobacteriota bacterium]|nr:DUF3857 domain-containing protein [Acidobacteriota bacterium]